MGKQSMGLVVIVLLAFVQMLACNGGNPPSVDGVSADGAGIDANTSIDVRRSVESVGEERPDRAEESHIPDAAQPDLGTSDFRTSDAQAFDNGSSDAETIMDMLLDHDISQDAGRTEIKEAKEGSTIDVVQEDSITSDVDPTEKTAVETSPTPSCLPNGYAAYFASHQRIFTATFGRLNAAGQAYICKALKELETKGRITIAEPAASAGCKEPRSCTYITPTADERNQILAAKYAHAIWLDRNKKVSWSLSKYSSSELDGLFEPKVLFRNGTHFMSVVDHSPTQAWTYLSTRKLLRGDPKSSMLAVIDDLRTTDTKTEFVHGIRTGTNPDPVNTAYTLDEALRTRVTKAGGTTVRVSRRGCHSMSRIFLALLRAMNIPGQEVHAGRWFGNGHSTPHLPVFSLVMPHGDDFYLATLRATPTKALPAPESFYSLKANTAVCGTNRGCLGRRYASLNAIAYPARYTMQRCCKPKNYGYTSCSQYLSANFATTLTSTELSTAATSISAKCPP